MRKIVRGWLLGLVCVGAIGCPEEEEVAENKAPAWLSDTYCKQAFACGCVNTAGFSSYEACRLTIDGELLTLQRDAVEAGLLYDASCLSRALDRVEDMACSRDPSDLEGCNACFIYHGLVAEGEPCTRVGTNSDCAQGLACVERTTHDGDPIDVCVRACERIGEGELCALDGPIYAVRRDCAEGLVCDATETGACVRLPSAAMSCRDGVLCGPGAWCDASVNPPICAALKADSAGCMEDVECGSTWCRNGRCAQPLAQDVPCLPASDRCDVGLECRDDLPQCSPADALVCLAPTVTL